MAPTKTDDRHAHLLRMDHDVHATIEAGRRIREAQLPPGERLTLSSFILDSAVQAATALGAKPPKRR